MTAPRLGAVSPIAARAVAVTALLALVSPGIAGAARPAAMASAGGLTSYDRPGGGHVLFGFVAGATSSDAVLRAGLTRMRVYFDAPPALASAVRSNAGELALAAFTGAQRGKRVGGIVVAAYGDAGTSHVAVLFDALDRLPRTLGPMERDLGSITTRALTRLHGGGTRASSNDAALIAASQSVALTTRSFPDGTGTIGVAPGYTATVMQSGRFSAAGTDGAYVNVANPIGMVDPRGSMIRQMRAMSGRYGSAPSLPAGMLVVEYEPNLAAAWAQARRLMARQSGAPDPQITIADSTPLASPAGSMMRTVTARGTQIVGGSRMQFVGTFVAAPPDAGGSWLISATVLSAPMAAVARDMPALFAMQRSERLDNAALAAQTNAIIAASANGLAHTLATRHAANMELSEAKFQSVMARERASQASIDRSAAGTIEYINGTTWVHDAATGRDAHVTQNLGYALTKADPAHFTELSIRQYQPGVHY